jgi:hypothetical protein
MNTTKKIICSALLGLALVGCGHKEELLECKKKKWSQEEYRWVVSPDKHVIRVGVDHDTIYFNGDDYPREPGNRGSKNMAVWAGGEDMLGIDLWTGETSLGNPRDMVVGDDCKPHKRVLGR